jgi:hypothetical protein
MYKLHGHCCAVYTTGYIKGLLIKPLIDDTYQTHKKSHMVPIHQHMLRQGFQETIKTWIYDSIMDVSMLGLMKYHT